MSISTPFLQGLLTCLGLIVAIGAQNAFVLKQGLAKKHLLAVTLTCIIIDTILITLGVIGMGQILDSAPLFLMIIQWAGTIFLFAYGLFSFISAYQGKSQPVEHLAKSVPLQTTIITLLAISLLNPHMYLDTFVILASVGSQFEISDRIFFTIGAITASIIWFFALAFGAGLLSPLFAKKRAWQVLDIMVGIMMWSIAIALVLD